MAAKIGIKLADGTFFPIMDDDFSAAETLELTTVRDDQRSVQINLFKKEDDSSDPSYIGSLIVEDIHEKTAGEPTIELHLALDDNKNLSAEATDKDSGAHQTLRVSLETFTDQAFDDLDFDLSAEAAADADIDLSSANSFEDDDDDQQGSFTAALYQDDEEQDELEKKRGIPIWLLTLLILIGIAALVLGILLLTKKVKSDSHETLALHKSAITAQPTEPVEQEAAEQPAHALPPDTTMTEPPVPAAPEKSEAMETAPMQQQPEPPVMQEQPPVQESFAEKEPDAPPAAMGEAIRYKLRWGDTLWDLSETYYRNPWLYTKIAAHNKLKNPDWVMSGAYIEIPPQ